VAQGPGNSLDFYWQQDGTNPWNPEAVTGAGTTFSDPSITGNDGSDNEAFYYCCGPELFFEWHDSSVNWHGETVDNDVS
jgi:hypothetical protein